MAVGNENHECRYTLTNEIRKAWKITNVGTDETIELVLTVEPLATKTAAE